MKILNTRNLVLCFLFAAAVGRATPTGVPPKFEEVYQLLRSNLDGVSQADLDRAAVTNKSKIKGLILDLRFAAGTDYRAAATAADCFLNSEQLLLDWGTGSARATLKSNAITVPVAVLVNSETSAAAEALAAALRECSIGLILGATTAGPCPRPKARHRNRYNFGRR